VYVVADAWRGRAIDEALEAYVQDLHTATAREVKLADGKTLAAGGAAQIVAWVGHNRFMDRPPYDWPAAARTAAGPPKGTVAVACMSAVYLRNAIGPARVPLLLTASLLFAGSHAFEGAVRAFAEGSGFAAMRERAAQSYADGEKKTFAHVAPAFTNPADKRWKY
jgi:hypothetical protein